MFKKNSVTKNIPVIAEYKGAFITEWRSNGITYTRDIGSANVFQSPEEAGKLLPQSFQFSIRLLDAERKNAPVYAVAEMGKRNGAYVWRVDHKRHRIEFATCAKDAKHFATESTARKWCEKYASRTEGCTFTVVRIK